MAEGTSRTMVLEHCNFQQSHPFEARKEVSIPLQDGGQDRGETKGCGETRGEKQNKPKFDDWEDPSIEGESSRQG